jgi:hypothetical protein
MDDANPIDARRMLMELDFPAGEDDRRAILRAYADTLEPVRRVLTDVHTRLDAHTQQKFGIVHLLSRSLSDLLAGGHLASHQYLPQAYAVLRPVLDSTDLIELFAQDPEEATLWTTTERAHIDFAPAAVRTKLGRERYDEVHGHFSESGSHPRFAGAQISGGMQVDRDNPEDKTAWFRIGPMWTEHPSTLLIWPFAFNLALQLAGALQHMLPLAEDPVAAERTWLHAYLESMDAANRGTGLALDLLGERAESPLRHVYAPARESVLARIAEVEQESGPEA